MNSSAFGFLSAANPEFLKIANLHMDIFPIFAHL
jgi:hypothetical protein